MTACWILKIYLIEKFEVARVTTILIKINSVVMTNPLKINMISFDLFGVIVTEGHLISNVLMDLLPAGCERKKVKSFYEKYNLGVINEAQFWQALGITDYQQLRSTFLDSFRLDADLIMVVGQLKNNFQLSILSNLPPDWADELTTRFKFESLFNPVIFSGHEKCKKPQAEIYHQLISQSDCRNEQIAFIDDRLENLQAAHEQGIVTIYYQREKEAHDFKPDYHITKLSEVLKLFK